MRISVDGASIHVRSVGGEAAADTLVLIHGGPGLSGRYMADLERLAGRRLRVISYDQRGVGESPFDSDDPADYDLDAQARDLTAVLDAVAVGRIHLLGHSWGSVPAMDHACRTPDRVASLLLIGGVPPHARELGPGVARFEARQRDLTRRGVLAADLPEDPTEQLRAILPVYLSDPAAPLPAGTLELVELFPKAGDLTGQVLSDFDLLDGISRYAGAVLVLMGEDDPFGVEWATATQAAFTATDARLEIIERCGHLPWLECPDRFFGAVEDFLRDQGVPPP